MMPRISVFYIVRNEASFVGRSIESVIGLADEIVVVDTGSADKTVQVCSRFGKVRLLSFPWADDFSKARNYAVRACEGDWVMYLDADEVLDPKSHAWIRSATASAAPQVTGLGVHVVDCPRGTEGPEEPCFFPSPQVRLFRRQPHVRFSRKAGESVEPSILAKGGSIDVIPAKIRHHAWKGKGAEFAANRIRYYNELGAGLAVPEEAGVMPSPREQVPEPVAGDDVAVVMVAMNALDNTKQAVSSMSRQAGCPFRFYFLDNGSFDGTESYLRSVPDSLVIRKDENTGVARGRNEAAREALKNPSLKYIAFADNDIVTPSGWLAKMKAIMDGEPSIGILSATSRLSVMNDKGLPQDVRRHASRMSLEQLNRGALGRKEDFSTVEMTDGTLMMVRVDLVREIGLFDESFGPYGFEDKDYCARAKRAGSKVAEAQKVFIEHFGGASKRSINKDWHAVMLTSHSRYLEKWKKEGRNRSMPVGASPGEAMMSVSAAVPSVSIVVIAHNRLDMTRECLQSIKGATPDHELIFVDNGSTDGTAEWVKANTRAKVIENEFNLGVPKARNQGVRASSGNYVVLMDNDCVVQPGWLDDLFRPIKKGASISGIEAWQMGPDHAPIKQCKSPRERYDYLGGACCMFKREVFETAGLLDEGLSPAYFEDVDLSIRAKKLGHRLEWVPTPKVRHREHATLINGQKTFRYQEAMNASHARFKAKMEGKVKFEPELLPKKDKKFRILYCAMYHDYGIRDRGTSFEQDNFFPSFQQWDRTGNLECFDFVDIGKQHGIPRMSDMLVEKVYEFAPDAAWFIFFDPNHDPRHEAVRRITEQTPCKTIGWFCDSHHRYGNFDSQWAPHLDYCVTTAQMAYPRYVSDGFGQKVIKSQWFASPKYEKLDLPVDMNVTFVGQPHGDRKQVIGAMKASGLGVQAFGNGWGRRLSFDQMVAVFNRSKVNLNLNNACDASYKQIKGRNFEVPACGGFLLTGIAENLAEYYVPGKEVVTFDSTADMISKAQYYLNHEDERAAIARAGYERTMRDHTYKQRFDAIFARAKLL